jgi:hypothetical protein
VVAHLTLSRKVLNKPLCQRLDIVGLPYAHLDRVVLKRDEERHHCGRVSVWKFSVEVSNLKFLLEALLIGSVDLDQRSVLVRHELLAQMLRLGMVILLLAVLGAGLVVLLLGWLSLLLRVVAHVVASWIVVVTAIAPVIATALVVARLSMVIVVLLMVVIIKVVAVVHELVTLVIATSWFVGPSAIVPS